MSTIALQSREPSVFCWIHGLGSYWITLVCRFIINSAAWSDPVTLATRLSLNLPLKFRELGRLTPYRSKYFVGFSSTMVPPSVLVTKRFRDRSGLKGAQRIVCVCVCVCVMAAIFHVSPRRTYEASSNEEELEAAARRTMQGQQELAESYRGSRTLRTS